MKRLLLLSSDRLSLVSLACTAAGILLSTLSVVWLTPITGLVSVFIGTPFLLVGLAGYVIAMLRELSG